MYANNHSLIEDLGTGIKEQQTGLIKSAIDASSTGFQTISDYAERILALTHSTNNFIKSLVTKKNTYENIKADMKLKGLKNKEYIHSIGEWSKYIKYLEKELEKEI